MLRAPSLQGILRQVATDGVVNALVMNDQGSLIGSLGDRESDEKVVAAVVSNVWSEFEAAQPEMDCGALLSQVMLFETKAVAVSKVNGQYLVCVYGSPTTEIGLLKRKLRTLCAYLQEQLSKLDIDAPAA